MKRVFACIVIIFLLINSMGVITTYAETTLDVASANPGNVFSDNEDIRFFVGIGDMQSGDNVIYAVNNKDTGEIVWSFRESAKEESEVVVPLDKNGSYSFKISICDVNGIEKVCEETVFSRVMSGKHNNKFRFTCHFDSYKATIAEQMALIHKANADGYRDHPTGWPVYLHRNGDLSEIDYIQAINSGVDKYDFGSNISIPHQGCEKYTGSTEVPPTDTDALAAWAEYSAGLLAETGAKKAEIWNEPNGNENVTPQIYVNMVKASADAIKAFDKTIEVGACSLANPNSNCSNGAENCDNDTYEHWKSYGKCYFYDLVECGILDLDIDAITIHSYIRDVYEMPKQIKWFRDFLDSRGRQDIEIWITEYGWYTGEAESAVTELEQANIMVREYLQVMAADLAEDMTQYNLSNKYDRGNGIHSLSDEEHNFGVVQAQFDEFSETGVALSAKKSYIALAAMNALMANAVGKGEVHFFGDENEIAVCDFTHEDGSDIITLFSEDKYDLKLVSQAKSLMVYDFYGNMKTIYSQNGEFSLSLDENVTYIKGDLGEYSIKDIVFAISDEADLISFRNYVNKGITSKNAILKDDIALSGNWTSIGTKENKYSGTFDGNGKIITNIKGAGNSDNAWGLFAYTDGGEIKNLTISTGSDSVTAIGHQAALIVSIASNNTKITNCAGYGDVSGWGYIGGITYDGACIVENCYYVGNITGAHLVSAMGNGSAAKNCFIYGTVKATAEKGNSNKVSNKSATNSYFLNAEGANKVGKGTQISEETFKNGELTALLNAIAGEEIYGQIIGTDAHPVFKNSANLLYQKADKSGYMNNPLGGAVISVKDGYAEILSPDTQTGCVLICEYKDGLLQSITPSQVIVRARVQTKIPYTVTNTGNEVKAFFWQNLQTLKPLAESI